MRTFCANCGAELKENVKFCGRCGQVAETVAPLPAPPTLNKIKIPTYAKILSPILCLLMYVTAFVSIALVGTRMTLTEENVKKKLDKVDFADVVIGYYEDGDEADVCDWVYRNLENIDGVNIKKSDLRRYLNKGTFKDFIAEKVADLFDDALNGTYRAEISKKDVYELLDDNARSLNKMGYDFIDVPQYEIAEFVTDSFLAENFDMKELREDDQVDELLNLVRIFASVPSIVVMIIVTLALAALIIFINRASLKRGLAQISWTLLILAAVMLAALIIVCVIKSVKNDDYLLNYIFGFVTDGVVCSLAISSVAAAISFAAYFTVRFITKRAN